MESSPIFLPYSPVDTIYVSPCTIGSASSDTEAPYGYVKDPDNKDFWIIDEEAAAVVRLIFRLFIGGKNRNQIAVHLKNEQIPTPTFYMKDRGRGTCKNKTLNEDSRCKWNKATLTNILTRQEYCGDVVKMCIRDRCRATAPQAVSIWAARGGSMPACTGWTAI